MTRKDDERFRKQNFRRYLIMIAIFGGAGLLLPFPIAAFRIGDSFAGCLLGYAVGWIFEQNALRHYRCPICQRSIPFENRRTLTSAPILFSCANCQIEWETGLRTEEGSEDDRFDPPYI